MHGGGIERTALDPVTSTSLPGNSANQEGNHAGGRGIAGAIRRDHRERVAAGSEEGWLEDPGATAVWIIFRFEADSVEIERDPVVVQPLADLAHVSPDGKPSGKADRARGRGYLVDHWG